ncbi:DUF397 domain-containing protein [Streptomyces ehimensis]|uniref:DUF397 domain-containing protein n=1 Tax=Streptomyces ehimensis TaxID=68195 RepID=A0ABV9BHQ9_9ACTN
MNAGARWQKSSYSGGGPDNSCVELRSVDRSVALRESDAPGIVIAASPGRMAALIARIKADGRR